MSVNKQRMLTDLFTAAKLDTNKLTPEFLETVSSKYGDDDERMIKDLFAAAKLDTSKITPEFMETVKAKYTEPEEVVQPDVTTPDSVQKTPSPQITPREMEEMAAERVGKAGYEIKATKEEKYKITDEERAGARERLRLIEGMTPAIRAQYDEEVKKSAPYNKGDVGGGLYTSERETSLNNQLRLLDRAKKYYELVSTGEDKSSIDKFGSGLAADLANTLMNTATFGMLSMGDDIKAASVARKLQRGETLSKDDENILIANQLINEAKSIATKDRATAIGVGTSDMIPFMASIIATGGVATGVEKGVATGITNAVTKGVLNKLPEASRALILKNIGVVSKPTGSIVQAAIMPMTGSGTAKRIAGQQEVSDSGELSQVEGTAQNLIPAYLKSLAETSVETFSERVVGSFIEKGMDKLKLGERILSVPLGKKAAQEFAKSIDNNAFSSWMRDKAAFNGFIPEYVEETVAGIMQPIVTGEGSPAEFFEKENLIRTALLVGVMSGATTIGSGVSAGRQGYLDIKSARRDEAIQRGEVKSSEVNRFDSFNKFFAAENIDDKSAAFLQLKEDMREAGIDKKDAKDILKYVLDTHFQNHRILNSIPEGAPYYSIGNKFFAKKEDFITALNETIQKTNNVSGINVNNDPATQREVDNILAKKFGGVIGIEPEVAQEPSAANEVSVETPTTETTAPDPSTDETDAEMAELDRLLEVETKKEERKKREQDANAKLAEKRSPQQPQPRVGTSINIASEHIGEEATDEFGNVGIITIEGASGRPIFESKNRIVELGSASYADTTVLEDYGITLKGDTKPVDITLEGREREQANPEPTITPETDEKTLDEIEKAEAALVEKFNDTAFKVYVKKIKDAEYLTVDINGVEHLVRKAAKGNYTVAKYGKDNKLEYEKSGSENHKAAIAKYDAKRNEVEVAAEKEYIEGTDKAKLESEDRVLKALEWIINKTKLKGGQLYSNPLGVPLSMLNGSFLVVREAYKATKNLALAINQGIKYLESRGQKVERKSYIEEYKKLLAEAKGVIGSESTKNIVEDVEAKKADIERRREEELNNSVGENITKNAIKKANKPSKTKEQAEAEIEKVKKENKELIDKLEDPNTTEEEWDKLADELEEKFRGTSNIFWLDKKDGKIKFAYIPVGKNGKVNAQYSNAEPDSVGEYEVGDLLQVSNGSTNLPAKVTKVSSTGRVLEAKTDDGTVVVRNGFVLDANQVQANREINAKYDAELKALDQEQNSPSNQTQYTKEKSTPKDKEYAVSDKEKVTGEYTPKEKSIVDKLKELRDKGFLKASDGKSNATDEEIEGSFTILRAMANTWAKTTGKSVDDFYDKYVGDISEGKDGKGLQQEDIPETIEVNGEDRPTRNSNGQLIHPTIEWIKNFYKWFGDSKVVDKDGRPLVVYHGSPVGGIREFNRKAGAILSSGLKEFGLYFGTNANLAEIYMKNRQLSKEFIDNINDKIEIARGLQEKARNNRDYEYYEEEIATLSAILNGGVYPVYLKIDNIAEFNAGGSDGYAGWKKLKVDVGYKTATGSDAIEAIAGKNDSVWEPEEVVKDGIVARNIIDLHLGTNDTSELSNYKKYGGDVFLIFDGNPQNIKSATNNSGKFSPDSTDILFQQQGDPKGSIYFSNGKAFVELFKKADVSTLMHELVGHLGETVAKDLAEIDPKFKAALKKTEAWAGVKDGKWNVEAKEKFARGFERYLRTGKAPIDYLQEVFSKFKNWMIDIYGTINGSPIDIKLSKGAMEMYDLLLTGETRKRTSAIDKVTELGKKTRDFDPELIKIRDEIWTLSKKALSVKDAVQQIKEVLAKNKARFTDAQYKSILTRLAAGVETPEKMGKLLDYVDGAVGVFKLRKQIDANKKLQSDIRAKLKQRKFRQNFASAIPLLRDFVEISQNQLLVKGDEAKSVANLNEYAKIARSLLNGTVGTEFKDYIDRYVKPLPKEKVNKLESVAKDARAKAEKEYEKLEGDEKEIAVATYIADKVNREIDTKKEEVAEKLDELSEVVPETMEEVKSTLKKAIAIKKKLMDMQAKGYYDIPEDKEVNEDLKKAADKLNGIIEKLGRTDGKLGTIAAEVRNNTIQEINELISLVRANVLDIRDGAVTSNVLAEIGLSKDSPEEVIDAVNDLVIAYRVKGDVAKVEKDLTAALKGAGLDAKIAKRASEVLDSRKYKFFGGDARMNVATDILDDMLTMIKNSDELTDSQVVRLRNALVAYEAGIIIKDATEVAKEWKARHNTDTQGNGLINGLIRAYKNVVFRNKVEPYSTTRGIKNTQRDIEIIDMALVDFMLGTTSNADVVQFRNISQRGYTNYANSAEAAAKMYDIKLKGTRPDQRMAVFMLMQEERHRANPIVVTLADGSQVKMRWDDEGFPKEYKNRITYFLSKSQKDWLTDERRINDKYFVYDEDGVLDIKESLAKVKNGQRIHDVLTEVGEQLKHYTEANAARSGSQTVMEDNYVVFKVKRDHPLNGDLKYGRTEDVDDTLFVTDSISGGIPDMTDGSVHNRTYHVNYVETNPDIAYKSKIRSVMRDYYMTDALRGYIASLDQTISNIRKMSGSAEYDYLIDILTSLKDAEIARAKKMLTHAKESLSTEVASSGNAIARNSLLVNVLKPFKDFAANFTRLATMRPKTWFSMLTTDVEGYNDLIDDVGSPATNLTYKWDNTVGETFGKAANDLSSLVPSIGDMPFVQRNWVFSFNERFKERAGKEFDIDKYNSDPNYKADNYDSIIDAGAVADQEIKSNWGRENMGTTPLKKRVIPFARATDIDKRSAWGIIASSMQSFSATDNRSFIGALKMLYDASARKINGDNSLETNRELVLARRIIVSRYFSNVVYAYAQQAFASLIAAWMDDEEWKDQKDEVIKEITNIKTASITSALSLFMGSHGNLMKPVYGYGVYWINKHAEDMIEDHVSDLKKMKAKPEDIKEFRVKMYGVKDEAIKVLKKTTYAEPFDLNGVYGIPTIARLTTPPVVSHPVEKVYDFMDSAGELSESLEYSGPSKKANAEFGTLAAANMISDAMIIAGGAKPSLSLIRNAVATFAPIPLGDPLDPNTKWKTLNAANRDKNK